MQQRLHCKPCQQALQEDEKKTLTVEKTMCRAQKQTQNAASRRVQFCLLCVSWHRESRQPQRLLPAARVPSAVTAQGQGSGRVTASSCASLAVSGSSVPVTSLPQVSVLTMSVLFWLSVCFTHRLLCKELGSPCACQVL